MIDKISKVKINSNFQAFLLIWTPILLFYIVLLVISDTVWNFGDGEMHYLFSKFSSSQPILLLDHWGKPLFTLLTNPFANFGRKGIVVFNLIILTAIAFFNYGTLKEFKIKNSWLILVIVVTSPLYFENVFSGLTETLFAGLFSAGIYFIAKKKFLVAAIILSFTPFSRSEGLFLLPLIFLFYIWFKEYKTSLFLLTGFIIYGFVGFFTLDDFWWIITKNPYQAEDGIYGSGNLFHFILSYKKVWGLYCFFLVIFATILFVFKLIKDKFTFQNKVLLLAFLSFWLVLCMHSVLWWKGIRGSAGLVRVLVATLSGSLLLIPLLFDFIAKKYPKISMFLTGIFSIIFIITIFKTYKLPINEDEVYKTQKRATSWYLSSEFAGKQLIVGDVVIRSISNKNPFDPAELCSPAFLDKVNPAKNLPSGSLIAWDAKFFPVEERLPLDKFIDNPYFDTEAVFTAKDSTYIREGDLYQIYFFKRNDIPFSEE